MAYASMGNNIAAYGQVNRIGGVTDADPHKLVSMLLDGVLGKLAMVKGFLIRKDIASKGVAIGQAIAIISGLRASLNKQAGGDLATNLDDLYEYMEHRLAQANINNDVAIIDEIVSLLREIKTAWQAIPVEIRSKPSSALTAAS